jgi:hypothetical protein
MAINPLSIKPPGHPVAKTYTPLNGHRYKVTDHDSWVSLAKGVGIGAWDLIRYNYPGLPSDPQQAAREVNWYLQEYVGCTRVTHDNRNYQFSGSANPGQIWLPNPAAAPAPAPAAAPLSPDETARRAVLAALRGRAIAGMNFGIGRIYIIAYDYEIIANAVESGKIGVKVDPSLSNKAVYHPGINRIDVAPGGSDVSLIIHECTHAIFDVHKIRTRVEETEGLAYTAQALYGLLKYGPQARYIVSEDPGHPISWAAWQMIFDQSSALAQVLRLRPDHWVSADEASSLFWAIKNTTWYAPRVGHDEVNDGVPGVDAHEFTSDQDPM